MSVNTAVELLPTLNSEKSQNLQTVYQAIKYITKLWTNISKTFLYLWKWWLELRPL